MIRDTVLFVPTGGWVRSEFLTSAIRVMTDPDVPVAEFRDLQCGPVMGMARCAIVAEFLKTDHEWLLMIDADMTFTPGTIRVLREAADPDLRPVMGALCVSVNSDGQKFPTIYRADRTEDEFGFTSWEPNKIPRDSIIECDATGAACLLTHRSVYEKMEKFSPMNAGLWFGEMNVGNRLFGEDFSFCIRCRAAGIPVHVCTTARTGHVKSAVLGGAGP